MLDLIEFSKAKFAVSESGTVIEPITIKRIGTGDGIASVRVSLVSDSATIGRDVQRLVQTVTWENGDKTDKTIEVVPIPDNYSEVKESVFIKLSAIKGASYGSIRVASVDILDSINLVDSLQDTDLLQLLRQNEPVSLTVSTFKNLLEPSNPSNPDLVDSLQDTDLLQLIRQDEPVALTVEDFKTLFVPTTPNPPTIPYKSVTNNSSPYTLSSDDANGVVILKEVEHSILIPAMAILENGFRVTIINLSGLDAIINIYTNSPTITINSLINRNFNGGVGYGEGIVLSDKGKLEVIYTPETYYLSGDINKITVGS